ncbi:probable protein phosphatase 2C 5, partial [Tanacetum coccineum]
MSVIPQGCDRENWLEALPRVLVARFVKTDIESNRKLITSLKRMLKNRNMVASVGDSRCILDTQAGVVSLLIVNHRLEENVEEREHVTASGGEVGPFRCWPGGLCLSQSIRDIDVGEFIFSNYGGTLIIASDCIWDALTSDMVAQFCRS